MFSQATELKAQVSGVVNDPILEMMDSLMSTRFFESRNFTTDTSLLNVKKYSRDQVPQFDELVYEARLAKLDAASPFDLIFNQHVKAYIDLYAVKKRDVVSRMLGLAEVYFPLFEQRLDKYNLPIELKYLAIVESALNPNAVSKSGATGLWQFMYATGKIYGLNVTSYYDERRDPYKATEAACKYFTDLYRMFGDWQMVLAAYNGGPGTLNKAIRRSGGKKTYWEVRPYLPLETQGYVPAFIAVNYVMNFTAEHNLYPVSPKKVYFIKDTVMVKQHLAFNQVSAVLGIPVEDLVYLNPAYKHQIIPFEADRKHSLCLPASRVGMFLTKESEIYAYLTPEQKLDSMLRAEKYTLKEERQVYVVKKGESVYSISRKFNCSVAELKSWNKMKNNHVNPGKKLNVMVVNRIPIKPTEDLAKNNSTHKTTAPAVSSDTTTKTLAQTQVKTEPATQVVAEVKKPEPQSRKPKVIYYTVQPGDTLWIIANRYNGVTVDELKKLNGISNSKGLKVGAKIKVLLNT